MKTFGFQTFPTKEPTRQAAGKSLRYYKQDTHLLHILFFQNCEKFSAHASLLGIVEDFVNNNNAERFAVALHNNLNTETSLASTSCFGQKPHGGKASSPPPQTSNRATTKTEQSIAKVTNNKPTPTATKKPSESLQSLCKQFKDELENYKAARNTRFNSLFSRSVSDQRNQAIKELKLRIDLSIEAKNAKPLLDLLTDDFIKKHKASSRKGVFASLLSKYKSSLKPCEQESRTDNSGNSFR